MKMSRRTVVKGIGAGIASAAIPRGVDAQSELSDEKFSVQVAHRWGGNSIAAVIKNKSNHPATIVDITSVAADYGRFNFSELTKNGALTLAAGEEVVIPFTVMGTPVKPYGHFDNRLQKKLKESLKITTTQKHAQVKVSVSPRVV